MVFRCAIATVLAWLVCAVAAQAATYDVNTTINPGDGTCDVAECTLREAIATANATVGVADTVSFSVGALGIIDVGTGLPPITDQLTVDGTTAPGYAGSPLVQVAAPSAGLGSAMRIQGAPGSTVEGLSFANVPSGVAVDIIGGSDNTHVVNSWFGLDLAGTGLSSVKTGVNVSNSANVGVGWTGAVIAPNAFASAAIAGGAGVRVGVGATGTIVRGSRFNMTATGAATLGQLETAISVEGGDQAVVDANRLGAALTAISDSGATNSTISANAVGFLVGGAADGPVDGIRLNGDSGQVTGNTITAVSRGVSVEAGTQVIDANTIGLDEAATTLVDPTYGVSVVGAAATISGNTIAASNSNVRLEDSDATVTANTLGFGPGEVPTDVANGILRLGSGTTVIGGAGVARNVIAAGVGGDGINASGTGSLTVANNWLGVRPDGSTGAPLARGILVDATALTATIGGGSAGLGNAIADASGVGISTTTAAAAIVQHNSIGRRPGSGVIATALPVQPIIVSGPGPQVADNTIVGGGQGAPLGGSITVDGATGGAVLRNTISGVTAGGGVVVRGGSTDVSVGGATAADRNDVDANGRPGVVVAAGSAARIGVNRLRNATPGVVVPAGTHDTPVVTGAVRHANGDVVIEGTVTGPGGTAQVVDLYGTGGTCPGAGSGDADAYLGSANVTTGGAGSPTPFSVTVPAGPAADTGVIALARETVSGASSALADCRSVRAAPVVEAPPGTTTGGAPVAGPLPVVQTLAGLPATVGLVLTHTLVVTNSSGLAAPSRSVTLTVPDGAVLVAGGGCTQAGRVITCLLGDVPPGTTRRVDVQIRTTREGAYHAEAASPGGSPSSVDTRVLATPVAEETGNLARVSGKVLVRLPGTKRFVAVDSVKEIPIGTEVDARNGRVTLVTAAPGGRTRTADFYGGLFVVRQVADGALTDIVLSEPLATCARYSAGPRGAAVAVAARKKRARRVWGNGGGGHRTRGGRVAATVQGTIWLVENRCDGTSRVTVERGKVKVTVSGSKAVRYVKAGHSYIDRPPKRKRSKRRP